MTYQSADKKNIHSKLRLTAFSILVCIAAGIPCFAETFSAHVARVSDGDTIVVEHNGNLEKIRLNGIDSPERGQNFYANATNFTRAACLDKVVQVQTYNTDKYQRTIADIRLPDGQLLNDALVGAGFAWWYQYYAPDNKKLQQLESLARQKHLGL